jgi:hypothetical protein
MASWGDDPPARTATRPAARPAPGAIAWLDGPPGSGYRLEVITDPGGAYPECGYTVRLTGGPLPVFKFRLHFPADTTALREFAAQIFTSTPPAPPRGM